MMGYLVRIPVLALGLLLFATPVSLAGDLEDVQAVFNQSLKAYNAMDVDGAFASMHKEAVGFGAAAPFAVDNDAVRRQNAKMGFASLESINVTPVNFQFRLFQTYAKSGGKWMLVSSHMSAIPSSN
jgi:hypothetical protein